MKTNIIKEDFTSATVVHRPPLFTRYPELEDALPYASLGAFPTPVGRLARLGHGNLWIKRDDLTSPLYGGNKVRKLEFTLADARARGRDRVITMGGIGTNHGLATAVFCRELGLRCRLLLFRQPVNAYVKRNMLLFLKYGAELKYLEGSPRAGARLLAAARLLHPRSYILPAGGSSPLGAVGFVNAMFELKDQIDAGALPEPRYIFCPVGTCGTMAGLALGALLAGLAATVIGVNVFVKKRGPAVPAAPKAAARLMRRTHRLLRKSCPRLPEVEVPAPLVLDDYAGPGYGRPTPEGRAAQALMREKEGISLEPTYTAKALAALLDFIKQPPHRREPILFWNTYNSADLEERAREADYLSLPPALRRLYESGERE